METTTNRRGRKPAQTASADIHLDDVEPLVETRKPIELDANGDIDDLDSFRIAIGHAQMDQQEYIEVGPRLFKYLTKNTKTEYVTYGDPGIKVYLKGTREENERLDRMTAEQKHNYLLTKDKNG